MPTYDFECTFCGHLEERFERILSPKISTCPKCKHKKLVRLISCPELQTNKSKYRDKYGTPIWFPKDGKPYYDRALRRTFNNATEKKIYMDDNKLIMHPSDNPKGKWPIEGGDTANKAFRKVTRMED